MDFVAPTGPVYQAGTLSGNPLAMAAGYTLLKKLHDNLSLYDELEVKSKTLERGLKKVLDDHYISNYTNRVGSMIGIFYCDHKVTGFKGANNTNKELFRKIFHHMLERGVYLPPSPFEAFFLSNALKLQDISLIINAFEDSVSAICAKN
jgi:glutamate-1-semialdehyde 2,1-aminomutase